MPLSSSQLVDLDIIRTHWLVSIVLLVASSIVMIPVYIRFFRRYRHHHPIIQSSIALIIPDILLVINFLPFESFALQYVGYDADYCTASSFAAISSVVASNAGVIAMAYTTHSILVGSKRSMNIAAIVGLQGGGWAIGIALGKQQQSRRTMTTTNESQC